MSWDDRHDDRRADRHEGPVCICGEGVAVPHTECMALLSDAQRRRYNRSEPVGPLE